MENGELSLLVVHNAVPEFPTYVIVPIMILATLFAIAVRRKSK